MMRVPLRVVETLTHTTTKTDLKLVVSHKCEDDVRTIANFMVGVNGEGGTRL
jgi:hypothetical protein